ncbi:hypothetical protein [Raoultella sp. T31]|uniref:hypothetical protein n=1 Tax=Raoultella sp. T31 TaxID=2054594 RepID=UPI000C28B14D|nr:hypothetical protein CWM52_00025 [Raoultella sp. T31]
MGNKLYFYASCCVAFVFICIMIIALSYLASGFTNYFLFNFLLKFGVAGAILGLVIINIIFLMIVSFFIFVLFRRG